MSLAVGSWIVLVVLLDLVVVGMLAATEGDIPDWLVNGVILVNPLCSYRLLTYAHFFPDQVEALLHTRGSGILTALLLLGLWVTVPVLLAGQRLRAMHRPVDFHTESVTP